MKGIVVLNRIKRRLYNNFDAFCNVIFGQTPPPGKPA